MWGRLASLIQDVEAPGGQAMSDEQQTIEISLEQMSGYEFRVRFDNTSAPDLLTDELPPLGQGAGPNPTRMLAVSVANCLAASLLFALRKYKNEPGQLAAKARATLARNEHGRWRVARIAVRSEEHTSDSS